MTEQAKNPQNGIYALLLDGNGGAKELDENALAAWQPDQGVLWLHLDRESDEARAWLMEESGINEIVAESLLTSGTRPRMVHEKETVLVVLRGVNLNPNADPEDMVGIRIWCEPKRIITLSTRNVLAVGDMQEDLAGGEGPWNTGMFLARVCQRLLARIEPVISELLEGMYDIEGLLEDASEDDFRPALGAVRRKILALSRHLEPQRDVALRLAALQIEWLAPDDKILLRESADQTARIVEQLNHLREWAAVLRDEFNQHQSHQLNRTIYLLTVVSTFLLPLTFLTGLLGVNLSGIPWATSKWAFAGFLAIMTLLGGIELILLRKLRLKRKK